MSALVQCMNLTKCYVKGKAPAVSDLNLTIERGHIVGLLGPNGSGKTTLIKMMNGLLKPTDGVVLIGGSEPGVETKKHVSYLPERTYLEAQRTVEDLVDFFADFYEDFKTDRAYEMLQSLNIQPGDSIELKVQLKNSDSTDTDWYMTNEVIQTLEDAQSSAEGGAYEYKLTYVGSDNTEKVLYNSDTVGGEGSSKTGEGLKELGNSTEKYFYLGRLASNGTGTVHLTIGIEGETQGNGYQNTLAKLRMNFAVEKVKVSNTITKTKIVKTTNTVKTGDTARVLLFCVLALISGLILLAYGIYTYNKNTKKRRRKGE